MRHLATSGRAANVARDVPALTARHFTVQHELPGGLSAVSLAELAPRLRALVLSDGTITRTLEAWTLRRAEIRVLGQEAVRCTPPWSRLLGLCRTGAPVVHRRRAAIHAGAGRPPTLHAESVIVAERLPSSVARAVLEGHQGIGTALSAGGHELRRELLWLGAGPPPAWSTTRDRWAVARASRIVLGGTAAIVLVEWFRADRRTGDLRV